jgi:thiol-disulfide isomerase/thioredoxin
MGTHAAVALVLAAFLAGCSGVGTATRDDEAVGWVSRSVLDDPRYPEYRSVYDSSQIAPEFVEMIRKLHGGTEMLVFFGIWCSDSQRELPRFLKLADLAGIPGERIRLYALDRSKKSRDGLTDRYAIERVPTFIFLRDGTEVGRIVERAQATLEADVLTILAAAQPQQ